MLLGTPAAMGDIWRRVDAASAGTGGQELSFRTHEWSFAISEIRIIRRVE